MFFFALTTAFDTSTHVHTRSHTFTHVHTRSHTFTQQWLFLSLSHTHTDTHTHSLSLSVYIDILSPFSLQQRPSDAAGAARAGLLCHHKRRDEESHINFALTHLPHLQCTYCGACKVHMSSVECICTHSYLRTLSRHANGQSCEHNNGVVLRASEPAYFSCEYYASPAFTTSYASHASTCILW